MKIIYELLISGIVAFLIAMLYNYRKHKFIYPKNDKGGLFLLQIVGLSLPMFIIFNAVIQSGFSDKINFGKEFENLPNYLMVIVTLITIYFLYRTLTEQRTATQISEFENRFFKFMDYHRENVSQLKYRNPKFSTEHYWEGNQVFTVIYYEIKDLLEMFFKDHPSMKKNLPKTIDFIYQCVFYGVGKDGRKILEHTFKGNHDFQKFLEKLGDMKAEYSIKESGEKEVLYSGHVRRLGHYFRNIYQAVKYMDEKRFLNANEKYSYMTHFRAQMSVYEQAVLFFNSLSRLGDSWEWVHYQNRIPEDITERNKVFNKLWITKYDLIRNTLNHDGVIIDGISIKEFYPLVDIEGEEECSLYGELPFKKIAKTPTTNICRFCFNEMSFGYINEAQEEKIRDFFSNDNHKERLDKFDCAEATCKSMPVINELRNKHTTK